MRLLYYKVLDTSLGRIGIAASELGICQIKLKIDSEAAYRQYLIEDLGMTPLRADRQLQKATAALRCYLSRGQPDFSFPLDLSKTTKFEHRVFKEVRRIPYGTVRTYKEIARSIGSPRAARAVGQALKRNPIPIIIPCHRVVKSDGSLGGFSQGVELKQKLLEIEGLGERIERSNNRRAAGPNLKKYPTRRARSSLSGQRTRS
jgi:O-6-methylguanine DNA methyltransferase